MRRFSDREKQAIKKMTDGVERSNSYVLVNSYNDIFYYHKVEFHYNEGQSKLTFFKENKEDISHDKILEIENDIMEVSLLIDYLKNNGLIYLIKDDPQKKKDKDIANFDKSGLNVKIDKDLDQKVAEILYESMNHRIFVGYTLRDYVANNFKTIEELSLEEVRHQTTETKNLLSEAQKQSQAAVEQVAEASRQTGFAQTQTENAQKQTIISLVAVGLSIIAIISSILVAKFIQMDVKVEESQMNNIVEHLESLENRLDCITTKQVMFMEQEHYNASNKSLRPNPN